MLATVSYQTLKSFKNKILVVNWSPYKISEAQEYETTSVTLDSSANEDSEKKDETDSQRSNLKRSLSEYYIIYKYI